MLSMEFFITFATVILFIFQLRRTNACYLWGTSSGECTEDSLDPLWRQTFMPYCQGAVLYPACVPRYQTLPPSREFPLGRWFNHTITKKDDYIREKAETHIAERTALEKNRTLKRARENEYGDKGRIPTRFKRKPDCRRAFRNLFCWINFPRCDPVRDLTLPTCRSACENFFISCNYERGLWRCGKSKFFNGYFPEAPQVDAFGNVSYLRDFFPGQPFRQNKYSLKGNSELLVCTPAIDGGASRGNGGFSRHLLIIVACCIIFVLGLLL
mmetsp:Transcript_16283/g.27509  ORF Transcript_16283/g.27509 Transcript_16283/m.27509 type:complete len:269 (-) Transcript_16283:27-833(-)